MRVLLLDQFSQPGGAQQCLVELVPAMQAEGWDLMVGLPGSGPLVSCLTSMGVSVARLTCGPYHAGRKTLVDGARYLVETPQLARQVKQIASRFCPELVYVNGPRLLPAVALANLDAPVVFHSHSYLPSRFARRAASASLRRARAHVIACCEFVAQPWRQTGLEVAVVYNGVAGPARAPHRQFRAGPPVVGCIGRIAPEKRQMAFVDAAARIQKEIPDCRFLIQGAALFETREAARYEREVRRAAAGLPIQFHKWDSDIYSVFPKLDLVVVPSTPYEATTRVILEAFSAGVPVVARESGGIPEVVDHGLNGYLARNDDELARFAIELLTGPGERWLAMAEEARASWGRRFTLPRYRRQVLDLLARAAKN